MKGNGKNEPNVMMPMYYSLCNGHVPAIQLLDLCFCRDSGAGLCCPFLTPTPLWTLVGQLLSSARPALKARLHHRASPTCHANPLQDNHHGLVSSQASQPVSLPTASKSTIPNHPPLIYPTEPNSSQELKVSPTSASPPSSLPSFSSFQPRARTPTFPPPSNFYLYL
jgi:hypothetical protein